VFELLGQHERALRQAAEHRARFDAAFKKAAANITEPGESDVIEAIRRLRDDYYRRYDEFLRDSGDRTAEYFRELEPRFNAVRAECDRLLHLNQEAMRHKADAASATARRWFLITLGLAAALVVAGMAAALSLSKGIVDPVRLVTEATTRIAAGDLDASVPVRSSGEIGALAIGFNRMAERIRELRRSDLGQLVLAQQTTEAAIDSLYDPVIVTDSEGRVTRINAAAERLFGARAETLGKPIDQVARDARIAQTVTRPAIAARLPRSLPRAAVGGRRRAARVSHPTTPMRDPDGRLVGHPARGRDHLSEISRLKSEFIAAASHELRTPLTSVQMGIHLLLEGAAGMLDKRQQEVLEVCREDTDRLDRLMRQLLDVSKIESGASTPVRSPVRPEVLVREAADALRVQVEAKGLHLVVEAGKTLNSSKCVKFTSVAFPANELENSLAS
jgi:signal transduction histidine kinase